jgi:transcriptional regulator with XRE-family HTH domain
MTERSLAIGKRLRLARQQMGLSQSKVAKALNLSRPAVSEMEAGRRKVATEELSRLSQLFDVPMTWLACVDTSESEVWQEQRDLAALYLSKMSLDQIDLVLNLLMTLRQMQTAR